jgi:hypothetical protein
MFGFRKNVILRLDTLDCRITPAGGPPAHALAGGLANAAQHVNENALIHSHVFQQFVPTVSDVSVTADDAANVTTLTATPTSSTTGATFTYQWFQNGVEIDGATSQTLDLTGLTVAAGDTFSVEVTPFNGTIEGDAFMSSEVTVASINPIVLE